MLKGESEKRVWKKFVVKCKSPPAAAARMVFTNTWHQNYYKIALFLEILNIFHGQVGDTDEKGRRLILPTLVHHHHHHRHQQQHNRQCSPWFHRHHHYHSYYQQQHNQQCSCSPWFHRPLASSSCLANQPRRCSASYHQDPLSGKVVLMTMIMTDDVFRVVQGLLY